MKKGKQEKKNKATIKSEIHNIWRPLSLLFRHWKKINENRLINTGIDTPRAKPDAWTTTSTTAPQLILISLILTRTSTSASDLRLRPPPPTSASDLRPPPPTFASDLRLRLHCKNVNAPIYGIVGARIAFEGIAILKILSMMSVIRIFQNLLCSLYVQSDDERNVKPRMSMRLWRRNTDWDVS